MELNEKQKQGLDVAVQRYLNGERCTIIAGFAGTGKSTLVKFIINALSFGGQGIDPDKDVVYTSFTGKATQVLAKKGNKNTSTLHKLLFISHPKPDGTYTRIPVTTIPYKIVVVDEISMVPKSLIERLASYKVHVIGLGDPFQLPPINKNEDNHLLDNPHIFLDEIMRQEEDSEIIDLSMKIRNGEPIDYFKGKNIQIINKSELSTGMLQWADQILVATNDTRKAINAQMRELLGHSSPDPEDGDKVICYRNYWEDECGGHSALVNGTIGTIKNSYKSFVVIPGFLNKANYGKPRQVDTLNCTFVESDGEEYENMVMDKNMILTGEKTLDWKTEYAVSQNKANKHLLPYEFTYGYAITTHRAQGSEWDKIVIIEEKFPFSKEEHARWLYTACTRASEKLVLVKAD
jgi:exodeoxyribonuclease-5